MKIQINRSVLAAVGLAAAFASGCATNPIPPPQAGRPAPVPATGLVRVGQESAPDPELLNPASSLFRLGPGDVLVIEIMGDVNTRATTTVGPDGKIYYYLLRGLDVWGLTLAEARERLAGELEKFVRERPVVSLSLRTVASQRVWVLGRVNTPGVYILNGPTTLLDVIAQSGGLSSSSSLGALASRLGMGGAGGGGVPESADLSRSFVIRRGRVLPVNFEKLLREGDLSQNIYLQADDFVFLPSATAPEVHVLGAVVQPQSPRLAGPLTVVQAIALAGGAAPDAYLDHVALLRGSLTEPQIAVVSVRDILRGRAPDVRLEAGDIVYVPLTPYQTLVHYANIILDTFARTVGVNAGARAAGGNVAPIGINVSAAP